MNCRAILLLRNTINETCGSHFSKWGFLGVVGGCGYIAENGEVDMFMISKTTGITEEKLMDLSADIAVMTPEQAESHTKFIRIEIEQIIKEYENRL